MSKSPPPPPFRIPKFIQVCGKRIRVRVVPGKEEWGEYFHDDARIDIADKSLVSRRVFASALRHELCHAVLSLTGHAWSDKFDEEAVVRCIDELFCPMWEKILKNYDLL